MAIYIYESHQSLRCEVFPNSVHGTNRLGYLPITFPVLAPCPHRQIPIACLPPFPGLLLQPHVRFPTCPPHSSSCLVLRPCAPRLLPRVPHLPRRGGFPHATRNLHRVPPYPLRAGFLCSRTCLPCPNPSTLSHASKMAMESIGNPNPSIGWGYILIDLVLSLTHYRGARV